MSRPAALPALALALLTILPVGSALMATPPGLELPTAATPATPPAPLTLAEPVPRTEADVLAQAVRDGATIADGKVLMPAEAPDGPGVAYACPTAGAPGDLAFGVTTPGTALSGVNCFYKLNVPSFDPAKRIRVNLTAQGDHDVFLKLAPGNVSLSPYECSETGTNAFYAQCIAYPIPAGDYFLRVVRFASQDYNVTVFYEDAPAYCGTGNVLTALAENTPFATTVPASDGVAGCLFSYDGDADLANLARVNMTGLNTNLDLYVRAGGVPTNTTFDCRPLLSGTSAEGCNGELFQDGRTYILARRGSSSGATVGNLTMNARGLATCALGNGIHPLAENSALTTSLAVETDARCYFRTDATAAGGDIARFVLNLTTTNYDLYLRAGQMPTTVTSPAGYDCRPLLSGTANETCDRPLGVDTTFFLQVRRSSTAVGSPLFTLSHAAIQTCSLGTGITPLLGDVTQLATIANIAGAKCLFSFAPHPDASAVRVTMVPPASGGDNDLYVRRGALPTSTVYDCRPFLGGNATETCDIANDGSTVFVNVSRFSGGGQFSVTASNRFTCTIGPGNHPLAEGVAATGGLTSDDGASCFFQFVPNPLVGDVGQLELTPPAGSDFDLYLRKGAAPSTTVFDCKASTPGDAAERCGVEVTDATPLFGMVRRTSGSGDFTIAGTTLASCSLGLGDHPLGEGSAAAASLLDLGGAKCFFAYDAGAARGDSMRFTMAPPAAGNFDVYVKRGARPSTSSYDCRPLLAGNATESCELEVLANGPVYAMVRRSAGGGAFTLLGQGYDTCGLGPGTHELVDGATQTTALTGNAWAKCHFRFQPAPNADFATYRMTLTTSDFDLYVRKGAAPTTSLWDCRPYSGGLTAEECNALIEDGSAYYGMVKRFGGSGTFSVTASNTILPQLQLGVPLPGNVNTGTFQYWKVVVPADAAHLTVAAAGDPLAAVCLATLACHPTKDASAALCGVDPAACDLANQTKAAVCPQAGVLCAPLDTTDADLFVRHIGDQRAPRGLPSTTLYTCRSATVGTLETCTFNTALNQTLAGAGVATPANLPVVPMPNGGGKFFLGVRGVDGPARYFLAAAWLPPALPALPALPAPPVS